MSEALEIWGVKDPNISSQLILAKTLGYFADEGIQITYQLLPSGTIMPREILRAPQKPFAWTQTVITALILREQNLDVQMIAPLADISSTQQIIVREDRDIRLPEDLLGKQVGMAEGAAIYVALQNMAKDFGINLADISFVNLLPQQQLEAFRRGEIDAMACWEPWTTRAIEAGGTLYFSGTYSHIPGYEGPVSWLIDQSLLMTTADHITHDQEILCAIMRALSKATTFIAANLEETARLLTKALSIDSREAKHMLEQNRYTTRMDATFRLGIFSIRELLYQSHIISTLPPEEDLYTPELLKRIDPTLVEIDLPGHTTAPIQQAETVYTLPDARITQRAGSPLTFLLVDDSSVIREIFKSVITVLGGELCGEATTGREAISQYTQLSPDIVIMDLSMPDMTGIEAIEAILKFDPHASIVVLSGSDFPETRQDVFDLGAKMFISKPFKLDVVTTAIQTIVC
ncbi:response regulator [candidate division KSB3 bacterium]|uniref:Response regulator n=1 Tax=candidate division KSB3 bacterium TaxID=2044937 RepID=A0A9D5K0Z6_9BACT|nr:response regulator [candidate division KSB3 bacterium]MBD3327352.1 response regulator [candidate division KSB3 bacterium]